MRIQVNVSDEMVKRIDEIASLLGVSRSAMCAFFVGQGVFSYEKVLSVTDDTLDSFKASLLSQLVHGLPADE